MASSDSRDQVQEVSHLLSDHVQIPAALLAVPYTHESVLSYTALFPGA